jgi:hypothetical protein
MPADRRKFATDFAGQARTMAITPAFGLRARTAGEREPDLTSAVVIQRATRQDMRRLAACLDGLAAPVSRGYARLEHVAFQ